MAKEKNESLSGDFEFFEDEEETALKNRTAGDMAKKLREELKKCQKERQEYLNGWQRAKADLINERKNLEKEKAEFTQFAAVEFAASVLPVIDSFEMAMKDGGWKNTDKDWRDGMENIYTQLLGILKENKIEQLNPEGEAFDPMYHESVETVEMKEKEKDNTVVEVLQKGYVLDGRVIRPARVRVAQYNKNLDS